MKKLIYLFILICSLVFNACGGSDDNISTDGDTDNEPTDGDEEITLEDNQALITIENGGQLNFELANGDSVSVSVPAEAITEDIVISIEELQTAPAISFGEVAFNGINLEPDGLEFFEPVTITIYHSTPFAEADQVYLAWVDNDSEANFVSSTASTDQTVGHVFHFSNYSGVKMSEAELATMCEKAKSYKGGKKCKDNVPKRNNLAICTANYHTDTPAEAQLFIEMGTIINRQSLESTVALPLPDDFYCAKPGNKAWQRAKDIFACRASLGSNNDSGFLDSDFVEEVKKAWSKFHTQLTYKWIELTPIEGDSCIEGRAKRWQEEYYCIKASPADDVEDEEVDENFQVGYAVIVHEFLQLDIPGDEKKRCGWYKNCLDKHKSAEAIFAGDEFGDSLLVDLNKRIQEVEELCNNLWDIKLSVDVLSDYSFSGMEESRDDYTIDVELKKIAIDFDTEDMEIASGNIDEKGGIAPGGIDTNGNALQLPFKIYMDGFATKGTIIQNSFFHDINSVSNWDVTDNGSSFTCNMDFACGSVTDYEVRKHDMANHPDVPDNMAWEASAQFIVFSTLPSKSLKWGVYDLPKNTTYLRWRIQDMADICKNDTEEGGWDCGDNGDVFQFNNPNPSDERVVSDSLAPDIKYFNAKLTDDDVNKLKNRQELMIVGTLSNSTDINDGAVTSETEESYVLTLTPRKQ